MQRLSDISTIRAVMEKNGFSFSKALGQNFLINPSVCPRMAEMSGAADCAGAIEVGPGIGVLTYELSQVSKKVVTIELDKRLLPVLDETLADCDNVKVINDDVMKIDLHRVIEEEFNGEEVAVCANLPYYIYQTFYTAHDYGIASAAGVLVVLGTIIIATFALRTVLTLFKEETR